MIGGFVIAALLSFSSCKDVKEPAFEEIENFKITGQDFTNTRLKVNLKFNNSNSFSLRLSKLEFDLYADSIYFGHFVNAQPVKIGANSKFSLPLEGQAQTVSFINTAAKAIRGEKSVVNLKGKARVGRAGFYRTMPFDYTDTLLLHQ